MKRLIWALLVLTSCAPDKLKMDMRWSTLPISWSYTQTLDPTTILLTREGFEYWNKALNTSVFVEVAPDDFFNDRFPATVSVYQINAPFKSPLGELDILERVAVTADDRKSITIYSPFDDLNLAGQRTALRHETGHVLGMGHSDWSKCLMYYSVPKNASSPREACEHELNLLRTTYKLP